MEKKKKLLVEIKEKFMYLTFGDLEFVDHPNADCGFGKWARLDFENGYGISVITGQYAYTSEDFPYEVAVMRNGNITYSTPITDDVIGRNDSEMVTVLMRKIQELPKNES